MPSRTQTTTTSSLAYNPADFEQESVMEARAAAAAVAAAGTGAATPPPTTSTAENSSEAPPGPAAGVPPVAGEAPGSADTNPGVYGWLLAWGTFILLAILMARTQIGYRLLYYGLALLLLFLVLTNYKWFQATLAPLQTVSLS